jgi:hypothetical protein
MIVGFWECFEWAVSPAIETYAMFSYPKALDLHDRGFSLADQIYDCFAVRVSIEFRHAAAFMNNGTEPGFSVLSTA